MVINILSLETYQKTSNMVQKVVLKVELLWVEARPLGRTQTW